jgi:DNA-binding transcriptional MerR regulator
MSEPGRGSLPPKLYFRIGEVAELVGVEPHVLRYWEREFRGVRPTKSAKGQRVYSHKDVENLMRVRELLYKEGFTIAGAKKKLLRSRLEPEGTNGAVFETVEHVERTDSKEPVDRPAPSATTLATLATTSENTREQLLAMRRDIESFLADLSPTTRTDDPLARDRI